MDYKIYKVKRKVIVEKEYDITLKSISEKEAPIAFIVYEESPHLDSTNIYEILYRVYNGKLYQCVIDVDEKPLIYNKKSLMKMVFSKGKPIPEKKILEKIEYFTTSHIIIDSILYWESVEPYYQIYDYRKRLIVQKYNYHEEEYKPGFAANDFNKVLKYYEDYLKTVTDKRERQEIQERLNNFKPIKVLMPEFIKFRYSNKPFTLN